MARPKKSEPAPPHIEGWSQDAKPKRTRKSTEQRLEGFTGALAAENYRHTMAVGKIEDRRDAFIQRTRDKVRAANARAEAIAAGLPEGEK